MADQYDVLVVGAGVVGLSQAMQAARRGLRTLVIDRSPYAQGASIRNFGMVWPIGQPAGAYRRIALRSREIWLEVCREAGLWHDACGSIHLVTREDEARVLAEFSEKAPGLGYEVELLDAKEACERSRVARRDSVVCGLYSPSEMCVDSPRAIPGIARWLGERLGVEFRFGDPVTRIDMPRVLTGSCEFKADRVIVCTGADFEQLYPAVYRGIGIRKCKLQMLAVEAQDWRLGPMIASGLTLRHYENFGVCKSLAGVKERIARDRPELDRYGIHVMASQHSSGELILGDSHEYDAEISPFDKVEVDELILRELKAIIDLPSWRISRRWSGIYAKLPGRPVLSVDVEAGVRVVNAAGGAGMTMSLGLADLMWSDWEGFKVS